MSYKENLKNKLETLMRQAQVTNESLADSTGISRSSINRIRMNQGNPTLETLQALCDFFKVSLQDLAGHTSGSSQISAAVPVLNWNNLSAELKQTSSDVYAVLTPQAYTDIPKSSVLYIDKKRKPAHGDYVLVIDKASGIPNVAEYIKDIVSAYLRSCLAQVRETQLIPVTKFHILGVLLEARRVFVSV